MMNKNVGYIAVTFLVSLSVYLVVVTGRDTATLAVSLELDHYMHDFGSVRANESHVHRVKLNNLSKEEVAIVGVRTSCGCTVIENAEQVVSTRIKAGESRTLLVRLETTSVIGRQEARVLIDYRTKTNGPSITETFILTAEVVADYRPSKNAIEFGTLFANGGARSETIEILPQGRNIKIVSCEASDSGITTEVLPSGTALSVTFSPHNKRENPLVDDTVVVSTTSTVVPQFVVRIQAKVVPELSLEPEAIVVGSGTRGEVNVIFEVHTRYPGFVRLIRDDESIASVKEGASGIKHSVHVSIPDISGFHSLLTVECTDLKGGKAESSLEVYRF